jgi:hypothetical protein
MLNGLRVLQSFCLGRAQGCRRPCYNQVKIFDRISFTTVIPIEGCDAPGHTALELTAVWVSFLLCAVPAEGWVSGILPKPAKLDKRCPPGTSAKTCSTCLATADPTSCLKCQATANRLDSLAQCTTCANIKNRAARSACINCVAPKPGKPAAPCAACVVAYDAAKMIAPARVQAAVEACFGCHVKVAANVRAQCPRCFAGWFMVPSRSQQCVACLTKSKSLGRAAQCSVGLQLP